MITNKELTDIVLAYQVGHISKRLLYECFRKIAEHVFQHPSYYFNAHDQNNLINGAANLCVEKVERFDVERGKAFNFFVTIIGCYLRQENGLRKAILKRKHKAK